MSYSIHIIRQSADGGEMPITLEEWNAYLASDPELKRPAPGHPNYGANLVLLPVVSCSPDDWPWLSWSPGSISSDYPPQPMLKKMGQIARTFDAVIMSDDGDLWTIDEEGKVKTEISVVPAAAEPKPKVRMEELVPDAIWPYFRKDRNTDIGGTIIWLLAVKPGQDIAFAASRLAEEFQLPLNEASAALHVSQTEQPVGMPAPDDYEEGCTLCERLDTYGIVNVGCGIKIPPENIWKRWVDAQPGREARAG